MSITANSTPKERGSPQEPGDTVALPYDRWGGDRDH
jgi:hypothetical protein